MAKTCPSLPSDSLIGGNATSYGRDGLAFFEECERRGPIVQVRIYHRRAYIVTGPELIEEILVRKPKAFVKPRVLKGLHMLFGDGLLTADGDAWRHRRRVVQPVFKTARNRDYAVVVERNVRRALSRFADGVVRDVHPELIALCIRNLTETLFSTSDEALAEAVEDLASFCQEMVQAIGKFEFPYYAVFPPIFRMRFAGRLRVLETRLLERLDAARASPERSPGSCEDFLDRLAGAKDVDGCPMGRRAIRDEVITMLLAGHETAAAAVAWALLLLSENPPVLSALQEELDSVCGDRLPTYDDLERLPLLDRVLLETYRLYPPTHRIGRTVVEPIALGPASLVPGDEVAIPQWAVHRSERHFEAPLEFRPNRWSDALMDRLPRFAYFPFSGGPRVCIGQAMVVMEDALILGSIVKSFDFVCREADRIKPVEGLTLLPGHPGRLRLALYRRSPTLRATRDSSVAIPQPLSSSRMLIEREDDPD